MKSLGFSSEGTLWQPTILSLTLRLGTDTVYIVGLRSFFGFVMFAVGHLALGYLVGKATGKLLKADVNVPMVFLVAILPDVDSLVLGFHRGPTHSVVVYSLFLFPFIFVHGKSAVIYFLAAFQHSFFGDFLIASPSEGVQLLWPLTSNWYGAGLHIEGLRSMYIEILFFSLCLVVMLKVGDAQRLLQHHRANLLLVVPIVALAIPLLFNSPVFVPIELYLPHFVFLGLFVASILADFKAVYRKPIFSFFCKLLRL